MVDLTSTQRRRAAEVKRRPEAATRPLSGLASRLSWLAALATLVAAALLHGYDIERAEQVPSTPFVGAPEIGDPIALHPFRTVVWRREDGGVFKASVDSIRFAEFLRQRHDAAAALRQESHALVRLLIPAASEAIFADVAARVPNYADWYFGYTTRYVLMGHALFPAVVQVVGTPWFSARRKAPTQAIIEHMTGYLEDQYARRVLHPEETAAAIQAVLDRSMAALQAKWVGQIQAEREAMHAFLAVEAGDAEPLQADAAGGLALDWDGVAIVKDLEHQHAAVLHEFRRGLIAIAFHVPEYEMSSMEGMDTHEVDEDSSDEIAHVIVNLFSKIVDPIASEVGNVAIGVVAGSVAAGAGAPPAAVAIGLAATVGAEMLTNRVEESLTRPEFERNLEAAIDLTRKDVEKTVLAAFDRHIDQWVDAMDRRIASP